MINALSLGSIYLLFSLGLSITWAGLNILNLAHGAIFMTGAVTAWLFTQSLPGSSIWVVLPVAMLVCGVIALVMELFVFRTIRRRAEDEHQQTLTMVVATVAVASLLVASADRFTGAMTRSLPPTLFDVTPYRISGILITDLAVIVIASAVVAASALAWFVKRSRRGQALRALSVDRDMARLLGISTERLSVMTVFGAGALAGLAGVLLAGLSNAVDARMGESLLFKAFAIIIVAGIGSIGTTAAAAFSLALIETFVVAYWASDLRSVVVFALIILFLLVRPQGLAGRGWQSA